jgi:hypothetical protein
MTDDQTQDVTMKMISSIATPETIAKIDDLWDSSRSDNVRLGVATILEARRRGDATFCEKSIHAAKATRLTLRRKMDLTFNKVVVWFPAAMIDDIEKLALENDLKVPELLRGMMMWMAGTIPAADRQSDQQDA